MEGLTKMEKFILAYLWHEYFGAVYYSSGKEKPEEYLAKSFLKDVIQFSSPYYRDALNLAIKSIQKLINYWMIEVSGYEVKLTSYGQQVASSISKKELEQIKEDISKGKIN
ncbi:MAG: hypothetical protein J7L38_02115 [Thermoproteales archaeon]|nr:hypothetical protein [Thermoproteales archaeon]RLE64694.1 MAG: hypothetical protein DRJ47_07120 [Thermoprotei archaeon]